MFEYSGTNLAKELDIFLFRGPYTEAKNTHMQRDSKQVSMRKAGRLNTRNIIHTAGRGWLIKF